MDACIHTWTHLYCIVFIHIYSASASLSMSHSEALPTTALIGYCVAVNTRVFALFIDVFNRYVLFCQSFVRFFRIFLERLFKSAATQRRSRLQQWHCVGVNTPKCYRQLVVKDLPKVPT